MSQYWGDDPTLWNQLTLGSYLLPGVWSIDYDAQFKVDVAKSNGQDGAIVLDLGKDATPLTLTGRLVSRADWESLQKIVPMLTGKKMAKGARLRGERVSFDVIHPAAQLIGISEIYVVAITSPRIRRGVLEIIMRAIDAGNPALKKGATSAAIKNKSRSTAALQAENRNTLKPDSSNTGPDWSEAFGYGPQSTGP